MSDSRNGTNGGSQPHLTPGESNAIAYNSNAWSILSEWKKKLVTHEDYLHVHKILGILVLVSFVYRLAHIFDDMAFPAHPELTLPTIFLHWLLPITAFQFRIPTRRIRDGGRIWPQYRWHALAFTSRSCICLLLYYYEHKYHWEPRYWINYSLLIANMLAADTATWYYGPEFSSNSVREIEAPGFVKFFFSLMQFNASVGILFGLRCYTIPFFMMYAVQITPFIGTLRRKGLFTSDLGGAILYGILLVGGFTAQSIQYHKAGGEILHLVVRSFVLTAALLRMAPLPKFLWLLQNKYVIWTIMYGIIGQVRPIFLSGENVPPSSEVLRSVVTDLSKMRIVVASLFTVVILSCYIKIQSGYYPKNVKEAKQQIKKQL
jgi:hypothetical protein